MRAKVEIDARWKEFGDDADRAIARALQSAAAKVAAAAREAKSPQGYLISDIYQGARPTAVERYRKGWLVSVVVPDFRAVFFEKGTYAKRGRARSARAKAVEGSRGVKPQRVLRQATKQVWPEVLNMLRREFR